MGRPRKTNLEGEITTMETSQEIKHVVRVISNMNVTDPKIGFYTAVEVEEHLRENYFSKGFRLFDTIKLGEQPEGYTLLYILTRG